VLKVKVKIKGHVIRELSWILGMSYSVIDGLVVIVTVSDSFIVVIFLLTSIHFIHLFSILLPVCFNKFSV